MWQARGMRVFKFTLNASVRHGWDMGVKAGEERNITESTEQKKKKQERQNVLNEQPGKKAKMWFTV